jgi:hypothetical protein
MGITQSKSPQFKHAELLLTRLAHNIHTVEYDLKHTSDIDFRHSIKKTNLFTLSRDLLEVQTYIERDTTQLYLTQKQMESIQLILDDLAWKIQGIKQYK